MSYSTGIFGCFDDIGSCLLGCFVPCYLAAQTAGKDQPGDGLNMTWCILGTCCGCIPCAIWVARSRVQGAYQINENIVSRCILWWYEPRCPIFPTARAHTRARTHADTAPTLPLG